MERNAANAAFSQWTQRDFKTRDDLRNERQESGNKRISLRLKFVFL